MNVYAIRDGKQHKLNTLAHKNNILIMVNDTHLLINLVSYSRTSLQTATGFTADITFQGEFHFLDTS